MSNSQRDVRRPADVSTWRVFSSRGAADLACSPPSHAPTWRTRMFFAGAVDVDRPRLCQPSLEPACFLPGRCYSHTLARLRLAHPSSPPPLCSERPTARSPVPLCPDRPTPHAENNLYPQIEPFTLEGVRSTQNADADFERTLQIHERCKRIRTDTPTDGRANNNVSSVRPTA